MMLIIDYISILGNS